MLKSIWGIFHCSSGWVVPETARRASTGHTELEEYNEITNGRSNSRLKEVSRAGIDDKINHIASQKMVYKVQSKKDIGRTMSGQADLRTCMFSRYPVETFVIELRSRVAE